jgi:hypothetical protein
VQWSEVLSNSVLIIIRIYIDHMKFDAYIAVSFTHSCIFLWLYFYHCVYGCIFFMLW